MPTGILRALSSAVLICLVACQHGPGSSAQRPQPDVVSARHFDSLLEEFTSGHFQRLPNAAVNSGLHAYDGRLPDFSPEGIRERVA